MNKLKIIVIMAILTSCLLACDNNARFDKLKNSISDLKQTIISKKKKPQAEPYKLPTIASFEAHTYREPFNNTETLFSVSDNNGNPLQSFPLSMLKFTGTLMSNNDVIAYIAAPDGKVYPAKLGDSIGMRYGKIIHISQDKIELEEPDEKSGKAGANQTVILQLKDER